MTRFTTRTINGTRWEESRRGVSWPALILVGLLVCGALLPAIIHWELG